MEQLADVAFRTADGKNRPGPVEHQQFSQDRERPVSRQSIYHDSACRIRRNLCLVSDGLARAGNCRTGVVLIRLGAALALFAYVSFPAIAARTVSPDFGPNVLIFNPSRCRRRPSRRRSTEFTPIQQHNEFGPQRNAFLFLPGSYHVDVPVGYYTEVMGLGASPDDTRIAGNVHVDASLPNNNATTTFWRAAEGFSVTPAGGTYAVGGFAGCSFAPHARCRKSCSPSTSRLGERGLDVR